MFNQLSSLMKAALFYGIAFALILIMVLLGQGLGGSIVALDPITALAAVLLMQFVVTHDGTTRAGWRILGLHHLGLRTWGLSILLPFLVMLCTYGVAWSTGIGRLDQTALNRVFTLDGLMGILNILVFSTIIGLLEEIGWRGYLLPHLLPLGRTRALLLSGFLHGIWHLPLILLTPFYHASGNPWTVAVLFLLTLTAAGVFYGYLRLTSNSIWPVALAHSAFNMFWTVFSAITVAVTSAAVLEYWAGESGVITMVVIALVAAWLIYRLQRQPRAGQTALSALEYRS